MSAPTYHFDGSVTIVPPLNFAEINKATEIALGLVPAHVKRFANADNVFKTYMPLALELEKFEQTTPEGILMVTRCGSVRAPSSTHFLPFEMDVLLKALIKALPGHNWDGEITAIHEEFVHGYKLMVASDGDKSRLEDPTVIRQVKGETAIAWENAPEDYEPLIDLL